MQKIVDRFAAPPPPPAPITTGVDGTITIPAASFTLKNASAPVSVMTSADEGSQLLSNGCKSPVGPPCFNPESSSWSYEVVAPKTGSYFLTVNFSTYHMDQDLWVTINDAKAVEVGRYYTVGYWNETQSTEVSLDQGQKLTEVHALPTAMSCTSMCSCTPRSQNCLLRPPITRRHLRRLLLLLTPADSGTSLYHM